MRYSDDGSALKPHMYAHQLVVPATYMIVEPKKGHSTIFRASEKHTLEQARGALKARGFKLLYMVRAKEKHLAITSVAAETAGEP